MAETAPAPAPALAPDALAPESARLQARLATAGAALERHVRTLARLQGELVLARQETAGARGETVQLRALLAQAQSNLMAEPERQAERARLQAALAAAQADAARLQAEVDALYASLSWRISAPVRMLRPVLRRK